MFPMFQVELLGDQLSFFSKRETFTIYVKCSLIKMVSITLKRGSLIVPFLFICFPFFNLCCLFPLIKIDEKALDLGLPLIILSQRTYSLFCVTAKKLITLYLE